MEIIELLQECQTTIEGTFGDLSSFNFCGVYVLSDENNTIVYIGSSYVRTIQERLQQYLHPKDTGNTLGKTIAKALAGSSKYDKKARHKMNEAINIIKKFRIHAIEYMDLEYRLVSTAKPQYNNNGKGED